MIEIGNETTLSIDADARATRMRPDMTLLFEVVKETQSSEIGTCAIRHEWSRD